MEKKLNRSDIEKYLQMLGQRLLVRGTHADILVAGGAAIVLLLATRDTTKDIDAYFSGDVQALRTEVEAIAEEYSLREDWLNDGVKGYFYESNPPQSLWADYPGLRVYAVDLDYLLAMKVLAMRDEHDANDAKAVVRQLGLTSPDQVMAIVQKYIPARLIVQKVYYTVEGLFD